MYIYIYILLVVSLLLRTSAARSPLGWDPLRQPRSASETMYIYIYIYIHIYIYIYTYIYIYIYRDPRSGPALHAHFAT